MDTSKLQRGEMIAIVGAVLLGIGLFLPWYHTKGNGSINGDKGTFSGWDVHHPIVRILLLAAAIAPFVLAWIIIREHQLSWPRGQMTSVVAIAAFGLIFYHGIVSKPGDPRSLTSLRLGFLVALLGSIVMLVGSVMRQQESEIQRKPPGVI
jgi:hypothetical protein